MFCNNISKESFDVAQVLLLDTSLELDKKITLQQIHIKKILEFRQNSIEIFQFCWFQTLNINSHFFHWYFIYNLLVEDFIIVFDQI